MINQTQNGNNVLPDIYSANTNKNKDQKKATTKVSVISESKILEDNLAIANTSTPTNENLKTDLIQRTIAPVDTDLTDLIEQKVEDEMTNSPKCTVYFIWNDAVGNIQVRFSEVIKEALYKAGISKAELDNALMLSNGIPNNITCYYVSNLKINRCLKELSSKLSEENFFEYYDTIYETWKRLECIRYVIINEIMFNPRYIEITDTYDTGYYFYNVELTVKKDKFIADRVAKYLSTTTNILIKELYSKKIPEEKIKNLQDIISPDYLLSNDSSQEEIPFLSAESLLHHLNFAPHGIEYNLLVQDKPPKYHEDTV
jgi:hypothetical protein